MRKLAVALLVALFSTAAMADANLSELQKSVVNIETNSIGGHATGTFIDPLHILTVWHVSQGLDPGTKLTVRTYDGTTYRTTGEILTTPSADIGILTVDATNPYAGPPAKIKCGTPPPLTKLINIGNPLQFDFVATNMYTTGGKLSPTALKEISKGPPKASPPGALKPSGFKARALKPGKGKVAPNKDKKKEESNPNSVPDDEQARVFSNIMIVNGPIVSGNSGSALFDASDGYIVGVLHITLTTGVGSLTGLGGAVEMSGGVCQWIKDQVGDGVFTK